MSQIVSVERITGKIKLVRCLKVMLDSDLTELHGVETRKSKQAVRRNIKYFLPDFMFELSKKSKITDCDAQ